MAGGAVIGALRVVIGADSAALDKGLKEAQSQLSRFTGSIKNVGLVAAGALAGVAGGAAVAIRSALKDADNLGKLAQSIGLPVEELSKLKYAAELSDVSLEEFGKSIVKLSRSMSEVAGGNTAGAAAQAFNALGISVRDASGQVKSSDTILAEVADRFASYRDGANKTAIAVALFGRAGASMIPLLNQGAAAINNAKSEAEEFGLVVDSKAAAAAEVFNDNITRLGKVSAGVWTQIAAQVAPTLARISEEMVTAAKNAETLRTVSAGLEVGMKVLASTVLGVVYAYKQFISYFGTVIEAATRVANLDFSGALETLKSGLVGLRETGTQTADALQKIWSPPDLGFWNAALQSSNAALKEAIGLGERYSELQKRDAPALPSGQTNAVDSYLQGIAKRQAALTAEIQTIGMSEAAQESLKIKLEALTIAKEKNITVTDAMRAKIEQAASSFGELSQSLQEARQRWNFVEGSINTVASGLTDVVMGTKTAAEAFKEMALSIIRDFTQMIIKAQLFRAASAFMGGGFGGLGGGTPGFAIPGFANGGSFVVGGSGGIDSQLTMMRTTPGERVTVTKDGSMPGSGGSVQLVMHNDFRGADANAVAGISAKLRQLEQNVPGMALAAVSDANRKRPSVTRPR